VSPICRHRFVVRTEKIEILITERRIEIRAADEPKDDRPRAVGRPGTK
jgi:hypothetical protein